MKRFLPVFVGALMGSAVTIAFQSKGHIIPATAIILLAVFLLARAWRKEEQPSKVRQ